MFTQCTDCQTRYRLTIDELRIGHGKIKCTHCDAIFDALDSLSDSLNNNLVDDYQAIPELDETRIVHYFSTDQSIVDDQTFVPWEKKIPRGSFKTRLIWGTSTFLLLILLATQIIFYHQNELAKDITIRNFLIKTCSVLDCQLPAYQNVALIDVLDHTIFNKSDRVLEFRIIMTNNSKFKQPHPQIRLTLLTNNGDTMAERIFQPSEYLTNKPVDSLMPLRQHEEFYVQIVKPDYEIGGYQFKLI